MAFYLLTYLNDVNEGEKILINFHEQRQEKMKQNWERQKEQEKDNNADESDFSEMR